MYYAEESRALMLQLYKVSFYSGQRSPRYRAHGRGRSATDSPLGERLSTSA